MIARGRRPARPGRRPARAPSGAALVALAALIAAPASVRAHDVPYAHVALDWSRDRVDVSLVVHQDDAAFVLRTFVPAGVQHFAIGPDHILFVLGLLLLGGGARDPAFARARARPARAARLARARLGPGAPARGHVRGRRDRGGRRLLVRGAAGPGLKHAAGRTGGMCETAGSWPGRPVPSHASGGSALRNPAGSPTTGASAPPSGSRHGVSVTHASAR